MVTSDSLGNLYIFQWTHVPGKLKWISSGRGVVVGVNSRNNIYYRSGLSSGTPTGGAWVQIPGKLKMIDIYEDQVVGTNPGNVIFKSPVSGVPSIGGKKKWSELKGMEYRTSRRSLVNVSWCSIVHSFLHLINQMLSAHALSCHR